MVQTINKVPTDNKSMKGLSLIVELVGPAGSGKSTLSQMLSQKSEDILLGVTPFVRGLLVSPFFLKHSLLLMPTFFRLYSNKHNGRCFTRREMAWMAILNGWHHLLRRGKKDGKIIVLDQGPVFMLTQLHMFGPESLRNQSAIKWWQGIYSQWATVLNMVVWLDASNTRLLERIRTRDQWHLVKNSTKPEVFEFLSTYRAAYEQVISMLIENHGSPKLLRFDTTWENPDAIVDRLLTEFALDNKGSKIAC